MCIFPLLSSVSVVGFEENQSAEHCRKIAKLLQIKAFSLWHLLSGSCFNKWRLSRSQTPNILLPMIYFSLFLMPHIAMQRYLGMSNRIGSISKTRVLLPPVGQLWYSYSLWKATQSILPAPNIKDSLESSMAQQKVNLERKWKRTKPVLLGNSPGWCSGSATDLSVGYMKKEPPPHWNSSDRGAACSSGPPIILLRLHVRSKAGCDQITVRFLSRDVRLSR